MNVNEAQRPKQMEDENRRLKLLVAELSCKRVVLAVVMGGCQSYVST